MDVQSKLGNRAEEEWGNSPCLNATVKSPWIACETRKSYPGAATGLHVMRTSASTDIMCSGRPQLSQGFPTMEAPKTAQIQT